MHMNLRAAISAGIDSHGQHLIGVFPTHDDPGIPFVYTIGNASIGLPELIIVGPFPAPTVGAILNLIGVKMREEGKPFSEDVDIGGKFPLKVHNASGAAKSEWTIQAGQFLGHEDYAVQQLLLCDPEGRYPGEPGIQPGYAVPLI